MRNLRSFRISLFAVLVILFSVDAWADKPKILRLKDLQPGMKAIGFSVFKGVEPQPFDVVLGGLTDYMGNSLILSRVSGGPMDTLLEEIGAISGMSGSPVFIGCINKDLSDEEQLKNCISNGTLVGSTSYGPGSFIKSGPNFLLTPAEYMLGARIGGYVATAQFLDRTPNKLSIGGVEFINLLLFPKMENLAGQGGSLGKCSESADSEIKPGSMVTVFLANGAIPVGGSGTVTWRDDDRIYIFGHPLFGTGVVNYPFVHVAVADTVQTPVNAYKISGCQLNTKGAMLIDGAFEMAGVIGATAPMLPYQVELRMGTSGITMFEEIAASPMLPDVIKELPVLWAQQLFGDINHLSFAYQMRIAITNQPEIFVKNIIPAQIDKNSLEEVFNRVYNPFHILKKSGFDHRVEGIKVRLDIVKDFGLWTAKKSFLSQEKANPGEIVYANIILEELFSSATKQISIPIKVPEDFMDRIGSGASPNITVLVQGGSKFTDKRNLAEITSFEEFIQQLNQSMNYKTNVLYVQQIMPRSKAEQKTDDANAKVLIKPSWKWTDITESDLMQFPRDSKTDVTLTLSPALNHFIDLDLTFNLQVQSKGDSIKEKKGTQKKKWFWIF